MCGLTEHLKIGLSPKTLSVTPNSDLSSKISDISVMRRQRRVEKLEGVLDVLVKERDTSVFVSIFVLNSSPQLLFYFIKQGLCLVSSYRESSNVLKLISPIKPN